MSFSDSLISANVAYNLLCPQYIRYIIGVMNLQQERIYEFEQRVLTFAREIIIFSRSITLTPITKPIISQLVRSGTSIGANYMEANASQSTRDFISKAEIARKEAHETMYWLDLVRQCIPTLEGKIDILKQEVVSIYRILGSMCNKSKQRLSKNK